MTIPSCGALLAQGVQQLQAASGQQVPDPNLDARLDAQVLLGHVLGITRGAPSLPPGSPLQCSAGPAVPRVARAPCCRRAAGLSRRAPRVLVAASWPSRPRCWCRGRRLSCWWSAPWRAGLRTAARVADLGTGSGAVALALASERPDWQVVATTCPRPRWRSGAQQRRGPRPVSGSSSASATGTRPSPGELFDLLVSNPPYVAADGSGARCCCSTSRGWRSPRARMRWPACVR